MQWRLRVKTRSGGHLAARHLSEADLGRHDVQVCDGPEAVVVIERLLGDATPDRWSLSSYPSIVNLLPGAVGANCGDAFV